MKILYFTDYLYFITVCNNKFCDILNLIIYIKSKKK